MPSSAETIFALSSARGRAGVAVIRISGSESDTALSALTGPYVLPPHRQLALRTIRDPGTKEIIDTGLVVRFAAGASFTGEASAEIHCHGGTAVVAALLDALGGLPGLRQAEPGAFTRRAFDNNCLDLAQIEGLTDLVNAETEAQRRAALHQADGRLGRQCRDWSARITRAAALLEATIDFADEDIPDTTIDDIVSVVKHAEVEISGFLHSAILSERFRDGWRVALIGAPNAGKSSLINALALRDVAITSPTAGTTRDTIEVALDLGGYPVTLVDTAGLRTAADSIESEGIRRARRSAEAADLRVALAAYDAPLSEETTDLLRNGDLRVWNKGDRSDAPDGFDLSVSAKTGAMLGGLIERIGAALAFTDPAEAGALLRRRHRTALEEARRALADFAALADDGGSPVRDHPEIAAEHLRIARMALGRITGEAMRDGGVERLLDVIFAELCLGK